MNMEQRFWRLGSDSEELCVCRPEESGSSVWTTRAGESTVAAKTGPRLDAEFLQRMLGEGYTYLAYGQRPLDVVFRGWIGRPTSSRAVDLHADGHTVVVGDYDPSVGRVRFHFFDLTSAVHTHVDGASFTPEPGTGHRLHALYCHPTKNVAYYVLQQTTFRHDFERRETTEIASFGPMSPFNPYQLSSLLNRDRSHLVTLEEGPRVCVRAIAEAEEPEVFSAPVDPALGTIMDGSISPSGRYLALYIKKLSGSVAGQVLVYDVSSGRQIHVLPWAPPDGFIGEAGFLSESELAVATSIYDVASTNAAPSGAMPSWIRERLPHRVWSLSPDGQSIVTIHRAPRIVDLKSREVRAEATDLLAPWQKTERLVISRDGRLLATGGDRGYVVVYQLTDAPAGLWTGVSEFVAAGLRGSEWVTALPATSGASLEPVGLLGAWDGLTSSGRFPCGGGYLESKFSLYDARVQVFAKKGENGRFERYWIVFQLIGSPIGGVRCQVVAIGDSSDFPEQNWLPDHGGIECHQLDSATVQEFRVRLGFRFDGYAKLVDPEELVLRPTLDDYECAGVSEEIVDEDTYGANGKLEDFAWAFAQVAGFLLRDRLWNPTPLKTLSVDSLETWECVYEETGKQVMDHLESEESDGALPSEHERWQRIAAILGGKMTNEEAARVAGERLASRSDENAGGSPNVSFAPGDAVRIVDGGFAGSSGTVQEVMNEGRMVKVQIMFAGRKFGIELDADWVKKS